ncbi:glycoprotein [Sinu virus]|uniref:Glycoprotein n=1 Tax=Sinu virus TaxID=1927799 RepID=A0A1L5YKF7_9ORTO|nr:glycoprotein [Sinu virus]APP91608.1 glycoprotein [Sinu virus]
MYFKTIVVLLTIDSILGAEHCNKQMKQGPFKIRNMDVHPPTNRLINELITIGETNYEEGILIGYKGYYQSYSYQGGPLDPNTGDIESTKHFNLSRETLLEWYKREKCEVGFDIVDAWGSDSDACLTGFEGKGNWVVHKEIVKTKNNNHFAHHTCNRSWRCGFSTSKIFTRLTCKDNPGSSDTCNIEMLDENGSAVNMSTEETIHKGGSSMLLLKAPTYNFRQVEASCIHVSSDSECVHECVIEGDVVKIVNGDWNCIFNKCYRGLENCSSHKGLYDPKNPAGSGRTATVGDLSHLQLDIKYENEILRYNLEKLHAQMNKLSNMIHKIVVSLAKVDERLIGNLLGRYVATEFLSEEKFLTYPCTVPPSTNSNCFNGSIFKDGRWVSNGNPSLCLKLDSYRNITLEEDIEFWIPTIGNYSFHDSWRDAPGWSFIAQQKQNLAETMENTHWGGKTTSLEDIVNLPKGYISSKLYSLVLSNVFSYILIFVFAIFFVRLLKRF